MSQSISCQFSALSMFFSALISEQFSSPASVLDGQPLPPLSCQSNWLLQQMQQVLLQSEEAHIACCNYYSSHVSWERVTIDTWTIWYCQINWYWLQDFDTKCEDRRHKGGACHHIHTPQLCLNTLDTHQRIKHFNPYYFGFRFMMYENISQLQTHVWA